MTSTKLIHTLSCLAVVACPIAALGEFFSGEHTDGVLYLALGCYALADVLGGVKP